MYDSYRNFCYLYVLQLTAKVKMLSVVAEEGEKLAEQNEELKGELKKLKSESAELLENYNSERILRKKYYNIIEDMKGKIRVYCRSRPLSSSEKERVRRYGTIRNIWLL